MKINWGTGIVIGMVAFISFIMYFVVTMMSSTEYDHDLVVEDYYKAELHYQQDIDAEENANALPENIHSERTKEGYLVKFPESLVLSEIEGNIYMYRPSNQKLDFNIPFVLSDSELLIPEDKMIGGRWNIHVTWKHQGKEYLYKSEIVY